MRADEILKKRRDRAIAIVLSVKEREVDALLQGQPGGKEASKLLRKVVLDQINDFCDIAIDVAGSGDVATFEFNPEIWTRKINEIHRVVTTSSNGNH